MPPRLTLSIAPCALQEKREAKCHKHFPARKMLHDINKDLNSAVNFRNEESSPSLPRALGRRAAVLKGNRCYSPLGFVLHRFMIPLPGFISFLDTRRSTICECHPRVPPPQRLLFRRIKATIPPSPLKGSVEFHTTQGGAVAVFTSRTRWKDNGSTSHKNEIYTSASCIKIRIMSEFCL